MARRRRRRPRRPRTIAPSPSSPSASAECPGPAAPHIPSATRCRRVQRLAGDHRPDQQPQRGGQARGRCRPWSWSASASRLCSENSSVVKAEIFWEYFRLSSADDLRRIFLVVAAGQDEGGLVRHAGRSKRPGRVERTEDIRPGQAAETFTVPTTRTLLAVHLGGVADLVMPSRPNSPSSTTTAPGSDSSDALLRGQLSMAPSGSGPQARADDQAQFVAAGRLDPVGEAFYEDLAALHFRLRPDYDSSLRGWAGPGRRSAPPDGPPRCRPATYRSEST